VNAQASLFDEVVEASGLVALIAPFTITRLLIGADVSPQDMTREDLARALPALEQGLAVYLGDEELERATANLRRLAGSA